MMIIKKIKVKKCFFDDLKKNVSLGKRNNFQKSLTSSTKLKKDEYEER